MKLKEIIKKIKLKFNLMTNKNKIYVDREIDCIIYNLFDKKGAQNDK